ncbi:MAG: hypothetical protein JW819_09575, partial [Candidatus Krumholzibacteriota bacterium]|nr:hypothetical protein [Candidatus Krumholzibacteriota bacterium]
MRYGRLLWPLAAGLAALAWVRRFVLDDAFISFRYARHLAAGQGLVWNPGERVEGYTNFLWTLLLALPHRLGWDPVLFAQVTGLACFALTLALSWRLARRVLGADGWALVAVLLLGTSASFLAFATGGLETMAQACLLTGLALLTLVLGTGGRPRARGCLAWSFLAALAMLTRPDSLLPAAVLGAWLAARPARGGREAGGAAAATRPGAAASSGSQRRSARTAAALALPLLAVAAAWLIWKLAYYGDALPGSLRVREPSGLSLLRGLHYVGLFLAVSGLAVVVPLFLRAWRRAAVRPAGAGALALACLLWGLYLVLVGGDFMEFRLFVPLLPAAYVLATWTLRAATRRPWLRALLAAALLAASPVQILGFHGARGIESVAQLAGHLDAGGDAWIAAGRALGERFGGARPPLCIAVMSAGAVPYYADLPAVDMLGVNDRAIVHHGRRAGSRAGHRRLAAPASLRERGVYLVVGHPLVRPA